MIFDRIPKNLFDRLDRNRPVLVGLSGGPDSMALFTLLLEQEYEVYAAHLDHGLRSESAAEAVFLQEWVQKRSQKALFTKRCDFNVKEANLEDQCREARLAFFQKVYKQIDAQALCLGHQADEQCETVLKRLLEGGYWSYMGIRAETSLRGMRVLRPLLKLSKQQILQLLEHREIPFFTDPSNNSGENLRGRMRTEIIPQLEEKFGKSMRSNLLIFQERCYKIHNYLIEKVQGFLEHAIVGPMGTYITLEHDLHPIEVEHLVRMQAQKCHLSITRSQMENILCGHEVSVDDMRIVYLKKALIFMHANRVFHYDLESVTVEEVRATRWQEIWSGTMGIYFDPSIHKLQTAKLSQKIACRNCTLSEWYRQCEVPPILRKVLPVICENNEIVGDVISGLDFQNKRPRKINHLLTIKAKPHTIEHT